MKIALAQLNFLVGDFAGNTRKIIDSISQAKALGADLVVFPELSVCGYPPRDFLEFDDFIKKSEDSVRTIAKECSGIAAIVGAPTLNPAEKGKPLYNSAFFLADGRIADVFHKTLLPNYDVFDEYRYFEPNRLPYKTIDHKAKRIAVTICEDLWNLADDPLYVRNPMEELIRFNPDFAINIAASPFHYGQDKHRKEVLARNAVTYGIPVFYVNNVGAQTELIFDGGSMVVMPDGKVSAQLRFFEEEIFIYDTESPPAAQLIQTPPAIALIHDALVLGIRDYFGKMGFSKAILGLSGGIDSALTLVLAYKALGPDHVLPVLLPSRYSSSHSIDDSVELCRNLGIRYEMISIESAFETIDSSLKPFFSNMPPDITEENLQARIRAVILMALSNKFGYILLNTSNKSEAAVGYGTLYGDMCGGLSVLGDVYKTQVYELSRYVNATGAIIPEQILTKPPSAELRPGQKDSDSLPEYDILDRILELYIEHRKGPSELIEMGYDENFVRRVLRLVNTSEYKRYQTPPILRVSPKAFGMGRRLPIVGRYLS